MTALPRFLLFLALPVALACPLRAQTADEESASIRVTVSINPDGSRSVYRFDHAKHRATATTTEKDGKFREKIRYVLDDAGRFASGQVFGPNDQLRFKTRYKYDVAGRLQEELQMNANDQVQHKIVYSFDAAGRPSGYAIYDGNGNILGQTTPVQNSSNAKTKVAPKK